MHHATMTSAYAHLEQPDISPEGGHHGVCRVEHQRQGSSAVGLASSRVDAAAAPAAHGLGPGRAEGAAHYTDVGCCLLKEVAALQHTCDAVACWCKEFWREREAGAGKPAHLLAQHVVGSLHGAAGAECDMGAAVPPAASCRHEPPGF